jgi:lysophospholipid acyltransferase (LPLAT)-like uncharacterized protein
LDSICARLDLLMAGKSGDISSRSGAAGPQLADEATHAVDEGIVGTRSSLRTFCRWSWRGHGRDGSYLYSFHAALKDKRRPHSHAPHQNDQFRIELRLPSMMPTESVGGSLNATHSIERKTAAAATRGAFELEMASLDEAPSHGVTKSRLYYTSSDLQPPRKMMPTPDAAAGAANKTGQEPVNVHYDTRLPDLPWSRRIQIPVIAAAVFSVIRTLGPTLRYEVLGWQHAERVYAAKKQCIWAFWHRVIIPIVWWYRNHGVVVMNTTAFDGQWTRKVIEWLGYGTAQGSSSRGGLRGLAVMARRLEEGFDCAFTIDGPRGPRYVAKPGPVMLARKSGCPIMVFHIGVERGKTFEKTWDHFLMPKPFSRTLMLFAPPIYVPKDATSELMEAKHAEMQRELERVRDIAESWFSLSEEDRAKHRAEFNS